MRALILFIFVCWSWQSQAGDLDRIQKALDKKDYEKAIKFIGKSLEKSPVNPGARYFYALLFYLEDTEITNIDSARIYINQSLEDFTKSDVETIDELAEARININDISSLKTQIAEKAFNQVKSDMSIFRMETYLSKYPESAKIKDAVFLRDSMAYYAAINDNSWEAFEAFYLAYPNSTFTDKAKQKYQQLLFKDYTEGDQLSDYITYLEDHSETPYRRQVEEIIFRRSTVNHQWEEYTSFIRGYPDSHLLKKAADILYYLSKANEFDQIDWLVQIHPNEDSLEAIYSNDADFLVPILDQSMYGFMSADGSILIPPVYDSIAESQLCGNITEDWLLVSQNDQEYSVNKKGQIIATGVSSIRPIGNSFILTDKGELFHRSGFKVSQQEILNTRILSDQYIAYQNTNYLWGIMSVSGMEITGASYEDIESFGRFMILTKGDELSFSTSELIIEKEIIHEAFDDYEIISDSLLLAYSGDLESLYDQNLEPIIELGDHQIKISNSDAYLKNENGYQLIDLKSLKVSDQVYLEIEQNEGWLTFKDQSNHWTILSKIPYTMQPLHMVDSLYLLNDGALYYQQGDTKRIQLQSEEYIDLTTQNSFESLEFIDRTGKSTSRFIKVSDEGIDWIYAENGDLIFEMPSATITALTDSLFAVKRNGKSGIIDINGQYLLDDEYEAINISDSLISMLQEGKIGALDLKNSHLIPPQYEARIERIGQFYKITRDGMVGVINNQNEEVFQPAYDEILYWNDSSLWAKKGDRWALLTLEGNILLDKVISISPYISIDNEKIFSYLTETGTGLIGNEKGVLLSPQYNDIINVGSPDEPVLFAEQHLKTASFFIVTYFNRKFVPIKSNAYRPEEYRQIYCDQ